MMNSFSRRQGYSRSDAEINVRHKAPADLRAAIISIGYRCGFAPSDLRLLLCGILYRMPDKKNRPEYPSIDYEVGLLVEDLDWFEVYDFIEDLAGSALQKGAFFSEQVNHYFKIAGVRWQLLEKKFKCEVQKSLQRQSKKDKKFFQEDRTMAAYELREAIQDLSHRPTPEISGAIQHAMAALECVARDVAGSKAVPGQLIHQDPTIFPCAVDQVVTKAWGYTSNCGWHLVEGAPPQFDKTELTVGTSGVLCRYLAWKFQGGQA